MVLQQDPPGRLGRDPLEEDPLELGLTQRDLTEEGWQTPLHSWNPHMFPSFKPNRSQADTGERREGEETGKTRISPPEARVTCLRANLLSIAASTAGIILSNRT